MERRYAPDQPRVPAGNPDGGQWTSGGGFSGGGFGGARDDHTRRRDVEGRVQTALNVNPRVASDADGSITLAQARGGGGRGRGGGLTGPGGPTSSQIGRREDTAQRAAEAISRVREIDAEWKPTPILIDADNIEHQIARNTAEYREASSRYADLLRARSGEGVLPPEPPTSSAPTRIPPTLQPRPAAGVSRGFNQQNLRDKLETYLLDPSNSQNRGKAAWFEQNLGYTKVIWRDLADQIYFDPLAARLTRTTVWGDRYEMLLPIRGANGRSVFVRFAFQRDLFGDDTLITGMPD